MGIQGRVFVQFVIDKDGSIVGIRTRGPDKNLEKEAQRIIAKLPTMTPGKQRGGQLEFHLAYLLLSSYNNLIVFSNI